MRLLKRYTQKKVHGRNKENLPETFRNEAEDAKQVTRESTDLGKEQTAKYPKLFNVGSQGWEMLTTWSSQDVQGCSAQPALLCRRTQ